MKSLLIGTVFLMFTHVGLSQDIALDNLDQVRTALTGKWDLSGKTQQISFVKDSYTGGVYEKNTQLAVPIFTIEREGGKTMLVWHESSRKSIPWEILELSENKLVVSEGGKKLTFTK